MKKTPQSVIDEIEAILNEDGDAEPLPPADAPVRGVNTLSSLPAGFDAAADRHSAAALGEAPFLLTEPPLHSEGAILQSIDITTFPFDDDDVERLDTDAFRTPRDTRSPLRHLEFWGEFEAAVEAGEFSVEVFYHHGHWVCERCSAINDRIPDVNLHRDHGIRKCRRCGRAYTYLDVGFLSAPMMS